MFLFIVSLSFYNFPGCICIYLKALQRETYSLETIRDTIYRANYRFIYWSRWGDLNSQCLRVALEERSVIQFRAQRDYHIKYLTQRGDNEDPHLAGEQACTSLCSHTLHNIPFDQKPFVILLYKLIKQLYQDLMFMAMSFNPFLFSIFAN